jgi:Holliday junction resolvase RusA-like endonuclease
MLLIRLDWDTFNEELAKRYLNNFTKEGRWVLWRYLEDVSEQRELRGLSNIQIDFVVIALTFKQRSLKAFAKEYYLDDRDYDNLHKTIRDRLMEVERLIDFCEESGDIVYRNSTRTPTDSY